MAEVHLKVFKDRSELVQADGTLSVFTEGPTDDLAQKRHSTINSKLGSYLETQIALCKERPEALQFDRLGDRQRLSLERLVRAVTSEVGRALVGLTVLQLAVKTIEPSQSIRLHKGSRSSSSFSWREGLPMRSLDKNHVTPILRHHNLLRLNRDGFMMTRTLAENYPYSAVYKANIRGARLEWLEIVEAVETGTLPPEPALQFVLGKLINSAEEFRLLAKRAMEVLDRVKPSGMISRKDDALRLVERHIAVSDYAARVMEIAMHSLMQAVDEAGFLGSGTLRHLSQMRSANKKHGNIGDIEIMEDGEIVEAWDAKYGKSYLRDELEELRDKLAIHPTVRVTGFVSSGDIDRREEIETRKISIEEEFDLKIEIISLSQWVDRQFGLMSQVDETTEAQLASAWIRAYVESIAQQRLDRAPIDEPCYQWLQQITEILEQR
ncbi:MAG: hypothetical protein IT340_23795 [Chloroflexi bacterium]|nr:hypothetical protein [Chloroflexota bacterium]